MCSSFPSPTHSFSLSSLLPLIYRTACNDNNACTNDTCSITAGCQYTSYSCSTGSMCSNDTCNTQTGCVHSAVVCNDSIYHCDRISCTISNTTSHTTAARASPHALSTILCAPISRHISHHISPNIALISHSYRVYESRQITLARRIAAAQALVASTQPYRVMGGMRAQPPPVLLPWVASTPLSPAMIISFSFVLVHLVDLCCLSPIPLI